MARTPQMHGSTTSQPSSSTSSEGSPDSGSSPPPNSNVASITSTSPVTSLHDSGYIPGSTMPITTMAFHSVSSGFRPVRPPPTSVCLPLFSVNR
ncbi:hypothetical protein QL285_052851 [Trifolium repens]|nr:hypothetical protein QL285_052851 [Trifolium repens]